jgi:hypothetical protein
MTSMVKATLDHPRSVIDISVANTRFASGET